MKMDNENTKIDRSDSEGQVEAEVGCTPFTAAIIYFGQHAIASCDKKCEKAWGINQRPTKQLSEDEDDFCYLTDDELGEAPADPGTYEGAHAKPFKPEAHNKWCVRECERCKQFELNEKIKLEDFSKPVYNIPSAHI